MTLSKLEQLYREVRQLSLQERTWLAEAISADTLEQTASANPLLRPGDASSTSSDSSDGSSSGTFSRSSDGLSSRSPSNPFGRSLSRSSSDDPSETLPLRSTGFGRRHVSSDGYESVHSAGNDTTSPFGSARPSSPDSSPDIPFARLTDDRNAGESSSPSDSSDGSSSRSSSGTFGRSSSGTFGHPPSRLSPDPFDRPTSDASLSRFGGPSASTRSTADGESSDRSQQPTGFAHALSLRHQKQADRSRSADESRRSERFPDRTGTGASGDTSSRRKPKNSESRTVEITIPPALDALWQRLRRGFGG